MFEGLFSDNLGDNLVAFGPMAKPKSHFHDSGKEVNGHECKMKRKYMQMKGTLKDMENENERNLNGYGN